MRYNGDRTVVAYTPFEIMRHAAQGLYDIHLYSMIAFLMTQGKEPWEGHR